MDDPEYDFSLYMAAIVGEENKDEEKLKEVREKQFEERKRREQVIQEGLDLFAKWFRSLWW